jgi:predicted transcriptional regulator
MMKKDIRTLFAESGLTQTQIAKACGITQAGVSRWTERRIPAERVAQVSELTGIPPDQLRPDIFGR